MNRGLLGLAVAGALGLIGFGLFRFSVAGKQPLPAIVTRSEDAHRAVSTALDARIGRILARTREEPAAAGDAKLVALTFDDGPYPVTTPLLLDMLADVRVRATFFLIGNDALQYPLLAERIAREGHEIANHTLTHPERFEYLDPAEVTAELTGGARILERYANDPAIRTMMRPPHGRYSEETVRTAQRAGYQMILWNDDPGDWRRKIPPAQLAAHLESHASAPDIILLHSGRMSTIEMLPAVVARFRKAGFTFVTVGEMMSRLPVPAINHPTKTPV